MLEGGHGQVTDPDDDQGPIGFFATWRALYATVVVYALVLIVLFYVLSVRLDFSGP